MKPLYQGLDLSVAPHPCGEASERWFATATKRAVPNILVHLGCIRPIHLNCDNGKTMLFHEVPRDSGPSTIKLRRAMARLSKHNDPSICEAIKYLSESRIADVGQVFRSLSEKVQQDPVVRCVEHMTSLIAARACSKLFDLIPKNVPGVHNDPCLHHGSRADLLVMASGGCTPDPSRFADIAFLTQWRIVALHETKSGRVGQPLETRARRRHIHSTLTISAA